MAYGTVSFEGLVQTPITFPCKADRLAYERGVAGGSQHVGKAVCVQFNGAKIELAFDGYSVLGELVLVESDNIAHVRVGGFVKLPVQANASITIGLPIVGSTVDGKVRNSTTNVFEIMVSRGMVVDTVMTGGVLTHVWVYLG